MISPAAAIRNQRGCSPQQSHRPVDPPAHGPVVLVARHAVGPEGDDEVGLDVHDESGDGVAAIVVLTVAVFVAEQVQFMYVERGKAAAEFALPQCGEPVGRPLVRVARAMLAERGGGDHDTVAAPAVLGHQAG